MDFNVTKNHFRLFLWIFSIAVIVGTAGIILQVRRSHTSFFAAFLPLHDFKILCQAPSLYDLRPAIDELLSEIQQEKAPIRV